MINLANTDTLLRDNLLENWYFGNPINQRGETTGPNAGYWIDRWITSLASGSATIMDNCVRIDARGATRYASFFQRIDPEIWKRIVGQPLTLSVLTNVGLGYVTTKIPENYESFSESTWTSGPGYVTDGVFIRLMHSGSVCTAEIVVYDGHVVDTIAAKLEFGTTQSLAHKTSDEKWVLNSIPDPTLETLRCYRYYYDTKTWRAAAVSSIGASGYFVHPVRMRGTPAITLYGESVDTELNLAHISGSTRTTPVTVRAARPSELLLTTSGVSMGECIAVNYIANADL